MKGADLAGVGTAGQHWNIFKVGHKTVSKREPVALIYLDF